MSRRNCSRETVEKIVLVAEGLFLERGYERTSMQDIVEGLGMSKGAIFHHFKSKEEIGDAVVERLGREMLAAAAEIAGDKTVSFWERFGRTLLAFSVMNESGGERLVADSHKPQNVLLHKKMERITLEGVTPILTDLVKEGATLGVFHTDYPYEGVEMLICYVNGVLDEGNGGELGKEEMGRKIEGFVFHAERILGAETGSLEGMRRILEGRFAVDEGRMEGR